MNDQTKLMNVPVQNLNAELEKYLIANGSTVFKELFKEMSALDIYERLNKGIYMNAIHAVTSDEVPSKDYETTLWVMKVLRDMFLKIEDNLY